MTRGRQLRSQREVELQAELRLVAVFDEDAEAFEAIGHDLADAGAAIGGRRRCMALHVDEASRQSHQLARALRLVAREVRPSQAEEKAQKEQRKQSRNTDAGDRHFFCLINLKVSPWIPAFQLL